MGVVPASIFSLTLSENSESVKLVYEIRKNPDAAVDESPRN
jgi:hypothetical protein